MNDDEKKYVAALEALHAGQLELARRPGDFAAEIMTFHDDPEIVAAAKDLSAVTGESVPSIVNRVLAGKAAEYLAQQKDKVKEPEPAPIAISKSVQRFRDKMGAGK